MPRILVTGGAGFIGSNFVHLLLRETDWWVVVIDSLTYAGNLDNLRDFEQDPRLRSVCADICDRKAVADALRGCDYVVNFAAETHVDRSLTNPLPFIHTNTVGATTLLEQARQHGGVRKFIQISTDEIYGEVLTGASKETDPIAARNPYSASKVGGEAMARAYFESFGLPVIITRAGNNYGPYQYPEKFIPLFITNAMDDEPLPLYGAGGQIRDRLHVEDHCRAILHLLNHGVPGEVYNVGAGNERNNLEVAEAICDLLGKPRELIQQVTDRQGHDRRYCLNFAKLRALGWEPRIGFDEGLQRTVQWYRDNEWWWRKIKSGEFKRYYEQQYGERLRTATSNSGQVEPAAQVREVATAGYRTSPVAGDPAPEPSLANVLTEVERRERAGRLPTRDEIFEMSYDEFLARSQLDQQVFSILAHQVLRSWTSEELQQRDARWLLVVGGHVIEASQDTSAFPSLETQHQLSLEHNRIAWALIGDALIEETGWSALAGGDHYPTIPVQVGESDYVHADLDTGAAHAYVDETLLASHLRPRVIPTRPIKAVHLGAAYAFVPVSVPMTMVTEDGSSHKATVMVCSVQSWATSPFVRINRDRRILVGRDLLFRFGVTLEIDAKRRVTRVQQVNA